MFVCVCVHALLFPESHHKTIIPRESVNLIDCSCFFSGLFVCLFGILNIYIIFIYMKIKQLKNKTEINDLAEKYKNE